MSELRIQFSENLKLLLRKEKSIAHVCRVLDINRQQFNRYLSGESLPGKDNLKKIARYFKVSEASLISSPQEAGIRDNDIRSEPLFERLFSAFDNGAPDLSGGIYNLYIPAWSDREKCLRGLMVIKSAAPRIRFELILNLRPVGEGWRAESLIRYSGLVRESAGKMLFLGTGYASPGDIFIINLEPFLSGRSKFFSGISTSSRADYISARRTAIEYADDQRSILALARKCGLSSMDSGDINPWVRAAISPDDDTDPTELLPRDRGDIVI